jgi:type I restriction enzyme S subunit
MEVRSGYKQTEMGLIPEDWELKAMNDLTSLMTNGFVGTATSAYVDSDDGVLYVQGYNVQENGFNLHGIKRVSKAFHARHQKSCLRPGDLLTIQTGDIGVTAVVPAELAGANCHALVISRMDSGVSEPYFYCQYFNSERGRAQLKEIETGSTMKHLNVGDMKLLLLPSPPVEEQRAIAEALSDVDTLLVWLDRLIAKKCDLKLAAMQQLLTGQTRLPGFSGEWPRKRLGEIGSTYGGLTGKSKSDFGVGTALYVTFMSVMASVVIDSAEFENVQVTPSDLQNRVAKGDLLFNGSSETPEEVAMCSVMTLDVPNLYLNSFCFGFRLRDEQQSDGLFLAYLLRANPGRELMKALAQGSTRYNISKSALLEASIRLPPKAEQTAIATLLSDMDAELAALEARRPKTRDLKLAMMQELLTGRTRLVEPEAAHA